MKFYPANLCTDLQRTMYEFFYHFLGEGNIDLILSDLDNLHHGKLKTLCSPSTANSTPTDSNSNEFYFYVLHNMKEDVIDVRFIRNGFTSTIPFKLKTLIHTKSPAKSLLEFKCNSSIQALLVLAVMSFSATYPTHNVFITDLCKDSNTNWSQRIKQSLLFKNPDLKDTVCITNIDERSLPSEVTSCDSIFIITDDLNILKKSNIFSQYVAFNLPVKILLVKDNKNKLGIKESLIYRMLNSCIYSRVMCNQLELAEIIPTVSDHVIATLV